MPAKPKATPATASPASPFGNLTQIGNNIVGLGKDLLNMLTGSVLSHVTDPEDIAAISRATVVVTAAPFLNIGADEETKAANKKKYDVALTVLYSYASAEQEEIAGVTDKAQAKVLEIVQTFLAGAVKLGLTSLALV